MGHVQEKLGKLNKKIDSMIEGQSPTETTPCLSDDVSLPLQNNEELAELEEKLKKDKTLAPTMVRYLYDAGYGKTTTSFIQSVAKKLLSQALAVKYSLWGRKGKKSFIDYSHTLNIILAAAAKRFEGTSKTFLMESFGKALAHAYEWQGRQLKQVDDNPGFC